jgi:hypothetical protein
MARLRIVLAALLAASALAVFAVPASAAVPAANTKFCKAVGKIGSQSTGSQPTKAQARKLISQFKSAAKNAPAKVKSAIGSITKYLGYISTGDVSNLANLAKSGNLQSYTKAISTYSQYVATNCT